MYIEKVLDLCVQLMKNIVQYIIVVGIDEFF